MWSISLLETMGMKRGANAKSLAVRAFHFTTEAEAVTFSN
jgi:hypothetical protein